MSADERYNGWTNRETWALNLWLSNDQGLYNMTRERVATEMGQRAAGEAVRALWEELTDPAEDLLTTRDILSMVREVGSAWRVDWDEIGRHWLEDVTENPAES